MEHEHHHDITDIEQHLTEHGVRPTAVRILVLKTILQNMSNAFSLQDITDILVHADSSSIYRALMLFAEHHILHPIDDGSGMQKYCVCHCSDHDCHHVHLTCTVCHQTICLKDIPVPQVPIPEGYLIEESEFVVKGICPHCRHNAQKKNL